MVRPLRRGRNTRSNTSPPTSVTRRARGHISTNFKFKLREQVGQLLCKDNLKSSFINIDGFSDAKLEDITSTVLSRSPDMFFLLETKRREEEIGMDISVPGYDVNELRRSDISGDRQGGGIAFYTKNSTGLVFKRHTPDITHADLEYVQSERFWVTIDSLQCKTAICGVYVACQLNGDKHGEWNDGIYWVVRQECIALRSAGYRVVVLGDMNGHIGNVPGQGVPGNNADINLNGERYLSFLKDCDMRHINGELRDPGNPTSRICSGLWTRQRGNSRSVIDFVSLSSEHISTVISMKIDDSGELGGGSDHNWIEVVLADKFRRLCHVRQIQKEKLKWDIAGEFDWNDYKDSVLENLADDGWDSLNVQEHASQLVSSLHSAAESVIGYKKQRIKKSMKSRSLPLHIVTALRLKREHESIWKSLSSSAEHDPDAVSAAETAYSDQKKVVDDMFCTLVAAKRKKNFGFDDSGKTTVFSRQKFWSAITGKVKQTSELVSVLSSAGVLKTDNDGMRSEIEDHLCSVFQGSLEPIVQPEPGPSLPPDHSYSSAGLPPNVVSDHVYHKISAPTLPRHGDSSSLETGPSNWLGRDFSLAEVKYIASDLKNGKAFGWDNIPSELLINAPDRALSVLASLFDKIKNTATFPEGWSCGSITLVHKRGLRAKLGNYRPITVLVSLSGFYSKLLNERLITVVETHRLLGECQNGFRKTRCGSDNIFILNSVLWKARALGLNVHLGFVDICKAYDSVNRELLWAKLKKLGIGGAFLETLKAMYSGDSVRCKFNGTKTRPVFLRRGLRQGCSLSPLLFALYISDIGASLSTSTLGFSLDGLSVAGLLFADDIVLISRTSEGLKTLYGLVKSHCDQLLLEINTGEGKSEVISPSDDAWDILNGDGDVELSLRTVLQYKYLGLESFLSIVQTCRKKQQKCIQTANKYKFACLHIDGRGPDVVDATLATWVNIAVPSIVFGCESIIFTEATILAIERIQSQMAKRLLGLPKNTANICAQTELGIIPFRLALYKAQLSFYFRVLDLPSTRWVKKALLEHLRLTWPSPYLKYMSSLRTIVNMQFVPPTERYLKTHLYTWSLSEVNNTLANLTLPNVTPLVRFKRQPYVFEHQHLDTIAQFRLSNAGLGNRFPRWAGVFYARQTSCPLCNSQLLDEAHVVFFCPMVENERKELDLVFFRNRCLEKGFSQEKIFFTFVNGLDWNGRAVQRKEFLDIGLALDTLRGHWLAKW